MRKIVFKMNSLANPSAQGACGMKSAQSRVIDRTIISIVRITRWVNHDFYVYLIVISYE
jgi:hypothetical protein